MKSETRIIQYYDRFFPLWGGIETHIAGIIENIPDVQFEIVTDRFQNMDSYERFSSNCFIKRFGPKVNSSISSNCIFQKTKLDSIRSCINDMVRVYNKIRYLKKKDNLIHIHSPVLSNSLFSFDGRNFKKLVLTKLLNFSGLKNPCILTIHQLYFKNDDEPIHLENNPLYENYFNLLLKPAKEIIVVEKYLYKYFKEYFERNDIDKKVNFIPNSINVDLFSFKENIMQEKIKVLYVGRIAKSLNYLIKFLENIPSFIEFTVVGSGQNNEFKILEKSIKGKNVKLYKNVSTLELIRLYQESNIVLNPIFFESISRVTLEAMSCGRPVIMIDKGDRTPVIHEKTGFLVDKSINSVIYELNKVHNNEKLLQKLSKNARATIESDFSDKVIIPKIKKIYIDNY